MACFIVFSICSDHKTFQKFFLIIFFNGSHTTNGHKKRLAMNLRLQRGQTAAWSKFVTAIVNIARKSAGEFQTAEDSSSSLS
jgi:hypothetical protein